MSAKKTDSTLTPLELKIMHVLWENGPGTVGEVQAALESGLAYTTVQTMLNVLLRKGRAKRVAEGRAFRYQAALSRERAAGSAVDDLVARMFNGSSEALLMTLVDSHQISTGELERIAQRLAARQAEDDRKEKK
ncbi:MAG: BlaI/MecI/CopY family transcriptional regulator [Acidobacteriota bacterium]|nr:BlaI/MecI/CopY family transcriptional regulator [Acidobacteriota bacterium]